MTAIQQELLTSREDVARWAKAKDWWGDGRTFGDEIALMHSELSEALEAFRDRGFESWYEGDKPQGVASEIADTFIRMLDTCARHDIDLGAEFQRKMDYNWTRTSRHGGKRL